MTAQTHGWPPVGFAPVKLLFFLRASLV
jgi:hypothetical protein